MFPLDKFLQLLENMSNQQVFDLYLSITKQPDSKSKSCFHWARQDELRDLALTQHVETYDQMIELTRHYLRSSKSLEGSQRLKVEHIIPRYRDLLGAII